MRRFAVLLPALGLIAGGASASDICTIFVGARAGDTCASLADAAGITVSQFLRANPAVTSCTILSSGTRYCVDPNYSAIAASPAPVASSPSSPNTPSTGGGNAGGLQVTTDGQCGNGYTCLGSAFGDCCSAHGWCGSTTDHCGATCQSAFGKCNGSGSGGSNPSQPVSAVVPTGGGNAAATTTVYVTSTKLVSVTAGVATATQIVRQTVPVTVTVGGGNGVATTTSTVLVTSTHSSLVFVSSTVTTIKTVTITDAKQCRTAQATPLPRARAVRGVGRVAEEEEEALQPGVVRDCRTFYKVTGEDTCDNIVERHNGAFELSQLYSWNRHLSDDCQGLWLDHWVCVGV